MTRRIKHANRVEEMQQMIYELQSEANQSLVLAEFDLSVDVVLCEADSACLSRVVSIVTR